MLPTFRQMMWMALAAAIVVLIVYPEIALELADPAFKLVDKAAVDYLDWRGQGMIREEMNVAEKTND